jgi:hypothetical protein
MNPRFTYDPMVLAEIAQAAEQKGLQHKNLAFAYHNLQHTIDITRGHKDGEANFKLRVENLAAACLAYLQKIREENTRENPNVQRSNSGPA